MKTILLTSIVLFSVCSFNLQTTNNKSGVVYVCNSSSATKYHLSKDCKGLNKCKAEITKVKLKVAKKEGKELCGFEK